ncbi:protein distal antenna [Athalia rosae]|uniref:protein distal antenna n=1 Tax=Athalia rosae TaxID=37344 RepID=UPI002033B646|nr:protein distal antenna [Athalia rosae]
MRGESAARPGKRPLRALSAAEKMDAIQRVHEGESKASVARDIGVPESTLRGWCKSEHKIRGMARNSCTPDSEAHSPASGSANAANNCNSSSLAGGNSEDEGCTVRTKRQKTEEEGVPQGGDRLKNEHRAAAPPLDGGQSKIDYAAIMASVAALRPEGGGSLLLQQLGLLSKNLLQVPAGGGVGGSQGSGAVVGLVENGLQYTRSAAAATKRQSQSTSAAAPTQPEAADKSEARNGFTPAAEAPFAPAPSSPRKTGDGQAKAKKENENAGGATGSAGSAVNNKVDEALWLWLTQQQQLLGQQSAIFNPGNNQDLGGSWFWKWYKQYGFAPAAPTPPTPAKKSPTKARALLDNVLGNNNNINNNNENVMRSSNFEQQTANGGEQHQGDTQQQQLSTEEAVAHGEKFLKWLEKCSEPSVSRMQIMQFRYLLDNLKTCRRPTPSLKRSRK